MGIEKNNNHRTHNKKNNKNVKKYRKQETRAGGLRQIQDARRLVLAM